MATVPSVRSARAAPLHAVVDLHAVAASIARAVAAQLGVTVVSDVSAIDLVCERAARLELANAMEEAARKAVAGPGRRTLRTLKGFEREKPTKERAAQGEYVVIPAERFGDTDRKGQLVLVDMKAKAGGAGEMYAKKMIEVDLYKAAAKLCEIHEQSLRSQLTGVPLKEAVDGGRMDDGSRLEVAAMARYRYDDAMASVGGKLTRLLIERRIVDGWPIELVAELPQVIRRYGRGGLDGRYRKINNLIVEGLDALADHFGAIA